MLSSNNDWQLQLAKDLRARARTVFAGLTGEMIHSSYSEIYFPSGDDCPGRYDYGRLCFISDHDIFNEPFLPFPVGEWSMFVPVPYFGLVMPWFQQNHGQLAL